MRTALVIGGRPDYAGPAVRILPRTGARVYLSERWKVDDLINNNDRQQQLIKLTELSRGILAFLLLRANTPSTPTPTAWVPPPLICVCTAFKASLCQLPDG